MTTNTKHAETCICGSADISVMHKLNSPAVEAKIGCESCGYEVAYKMPHSDKAPKTMGEVMGDLLNLWDTEMINKKLEKQLSITEASYFKEEMVANLIQLSTLIETASKEDLVVSHRSKDRIKRTLTMIQRIMPAMEGLEQASLLYFNEALSELKDCKEKIKFNLVSNGK